MYETKDDLKNSISNRVYYNKKEKISGDIMQEVLHDIVDFIPERGCFEQFCFIVPARKKQVIYKHSLANIDYHVKTIDNNWQSGEIKLREKDYYRLNVIGTIEVGEGDGYDFECNSEQELIFFNNTESTVQIQINVFTFKECPFP